MKNKPYPLYSLPEIRDLKDMVRRRATDTPDAAAFFYSRQVEDRVKNLPENYNQRVVLDVTGRGYTKEFVLERIAIIQEKLNEVYHNLPINVVGV